MDETTKSTDEETPSEASTNGDRGSKQEPVGAEPEREGEGSDGEAVDSEIEFTEATVDEQVEEPPPEPTIEEMLEEKDRQIAAAKEQMLRVAANFDNYRKRTNREIEDVRRRATQAAVKDLLPVFDNLERAIGHVDDTSSAKSMADGLRMVNKQFYITLDKMGIERVEALGKPFDPSVHDSIQHQESTEYEAGTIMAELQAGFRMGDDLLRAALVVVSKGPPAPAEKTEEPTVEGTDGDAEAGGESIETAAETPSPDGGEIDTEPSEPTEPVDQDSSDSG